MLQNVQTKGSRGFAPDPTAMGSQQHFSRPSADVRGDTPAAPCPIALAAIGSRELLGACGVSHLTSKFSSAYHMHFQKRSDIYDEIEDMPVTTGHWGAVLPR